MFIDKSVFRVGTDSSWAQHVKFMGPTEITKFCHTASYEVKYHLSTGRLRVLHRGMILPPSDVCHCSDLGTEQQPVTKKIKKNKQPVPQSDRVLRSALRYNGWTLYSAHST